LDEIFTGCTSMLSSLAGTNCIVFAQYALAICDVYITPARQTVIAVAVCTVAVVGESSTFLAFKYTLELERAVVGLSRKWSLRAVNILTGMKALSLVL
jgi:hypothetical protein